GTAGPRPGRAGGDPRRLAPAERRPGAVAGGGRRGAPPAGGAPLRRQDRVDRPVRSFTPRPPIVAGLDPASNHQPIGGRRPSPPARSVSACLPEAPSPASRPPGPSLRGSSSTIHLYRLTRGEKTLSFGPFPGTCFCTDRSLDRRPG